MNISASYTALLITVFPLLLVVRPTMPETTALGAAMAAGMAKGVDVWKVNPEDKSQINTDVFEPAVDPAGKFTTTNFWFSRCLIKIQTKEIIYPSNFLTFMKY